MVGDIYPNQSNMAGARKQVLGSNSPIKGDATLFSFRFDEGGQAKACSLLYPSILWNGVEVV